MEWYYVQENERVGPLTGEQFQELVRLGTISGNTYVWNPDLPEWCYYRDVAGGPTDIAQAPGEAASTVAAQCVCVECGAGKSPGTVIAYRDVYVCAACKPTFFQRLKQGTSEQLHMAYAGFWIRFCADFIDHALLGSLSYGLTLLTQIIVGDDVMLLTLLSVLLSTFGFAVTIAYNTWFVGRHGATLGKMACGLRIIVSNGTQVSYTRALGRAFGEILSGVILYIGYLMAAFDNEKRTLHDHLCDTRVVRVAAATARLTRGMAPGSTGTTTPVVRHEPA